MSSKKRQEEIGKFFHKEYQNLLRYLRSRFDNLAETDLEDVIADLMLSLINKVDVTGHVENLTAYIYRSLHNRVIDFLRKKKNTVSLEALVDEETGGDHNSLLADPGNGVEEAVTQNEVRAKIFKALDNLSPKQRAVWIATEFDGFSFRELSVMWNEPLGSLLARKHRATAELREALKSLK